ncbi:glycosyltransferase [Leifsonia shinshuensis]|uniref:glycosyltransferase n=1 Tax=Leifsonia shinshuensis TaxID=150026 RepID=UPI0028658102|nr:glycosyltransferase [Leifsonia shinshuensis]MDR6971732.1 glycosyltransferase involved in cell wall biosynthesis [Leifsonia shinshuensis]
MTAASRRRPSHTVLVAHPSAELYGSDRVMLESVSGLVDDGWRVVVAVPTDGPLIAELRRRGASVELCPSPVLRKSVLTPRGFVRFVRTALVSTVQGSSLLRRERPALVYVNTITVPLWPVLARLRGIPVLTHVHEGEASASAVMRRILALPLFLSRRIVVNSRFSTGVLTSSFRSLGERSEIVYNAVPGPGTRTDPRPRLDGPLRVTYIGRLSPRKGVDVAIGAVAQLRDRGVEADLHVVGSVFPGYEWYEKELTETVGRAGLNDSVRFHGFQPSVWDIVGSGDVVVVPSRVDEPFGNTAVEALLAARPVIASATSGLLEATAGYRTAVTVRPDDATALADALQGTIDGWDATAQAVTADADEAERRHSVSTYRRRIADIVRSAARR